MYTCLKTLASRVQQFSKQHHLRMTMEFRLFLLEETCSIPEFHHIISVCFSHNKWDIIHIIEHLKVQKRFALTNKKLRPGPEFKKLGTTSDSFHCDFVQQNWQVKGQHIDPLTRTIFTVSSPSFAFSSFRISDCINHTILSAAPLISQIYNSPSLYPSKYMKWKTLLYRNLR